MRHDYAEQLRATRNEMLCTASNETLFTHHVHEEAAPLWIWTGTFVNIIFVQH
jgi:hypothetical protein